LVLNKGDFSTMENKVLINLSDQDYNKLKWIADKLGLSISETLRSLIPSVEIPEAKTVSIENIKLAEINDLVPVSPSMDRENLRNLLKILIDKGWAITLARELTQQLLDIEGNHITVSTYKRLSRWVHPYRQTEREKYVLKVAQDISQMLFGQIIDRVD
jgi:hypothetical protein